MLSLSVVGTGFEQNVDKEDNPVEIVPDPNDRSQSYLSWQEQNVDHDEQNGMSASKAFISHSQRTILKQSLSQSIFNAT